MQTLICPHWAPCHAGQEDDAFMLALAPPVLKLFFSGDSIPRLDVALKAATKFVILRHHGISENGDVRGIRDREHAKQMAGVHAAAWMKLIPSWVDRSRIAVEGLNEPHVWPWGDESPENTSAYYAELSRLMALQGIRVVAGNLAVGWPGNGEPEMPPNSPPIWRPFEEMFDAIAKYQGYYGHHDYWYTNGPRTKYMSGGPDGKLVEHGGWGWWAGRSLTCPWKNVGIVITEAGIDSHIVRDDEYYGWHGLGAEKDNIYWSHLIQYEQQCAIDGRVVAVTPFTHDFYDSRWATFSTRCEPFQSMWLAHARDVEAHGIQPADPWPFPEWASKPWSPDSTEEATSQPSTPTVLPLPVWATTVMKWNADVRKFAQIYGLDPMVVHTLIVLESGGDPNAVNPDTGCVGLMQIMPLEGRPTAEQLKDPATNIEWGCKILADGITRHGSLEMALCAYGGVKDPTNLLCETAQGYLKTFQRRWRQIWGTEPLPINVPVPRTVDQKTLIGARWYAEEAVRKIEDGKSFDAREILLSHVIESLYSLAGDRKG